MTPELYRDVRELYKTHSIAEDARNLAGLVSRLTPKRRLFRGEKIYVSGIDLPSA